MPLKLALRIRLLAVSALVLTIFGAGAEEMDMVKLHVDRFTVVGLETRTSNAQEMSGNGPISHLWSRLSSEHFLDRIPNRVDTRIIAVYSDYASDKDGPYTYSLGAKVSSVKDLPVGMAARNVTPGMYAMFMAEGGAPAQMVVTLWQHIWTLEKSDHFHRAYRTDYEAHYPGAEASAGAHVDVYIGLQEKR